jgi:hypothetical protein
MPDIERRKYPRVRIYDSISYTGVDPEGKLMGQHAGVTKDISQHGIKIESVSDISSKYVVLTFIDLEQKLNEIMGKVIYSKKKNSGNFDVGICLQGKQQENIDFAKKLVRHYHHKKEKSSLTISPSDQC